jgi:dTDP-4-dehydrorhamnose 3,5-epimerase
VSGSAADNAGIDAVRAAAEAAVRDRPTVDATSSELSPGIDGVEIRRLTIHADPRGMLTPVFDTRDPFWVDPIVFAYRFSILPGRIKGWGMHELQTDRYFMVSGDVRVVLFDGRPDSLSSGSIAVINFTDRTPGLVKIPPGVWHADQNWGQTEAHIVNFPTRPYDTDHPDKFRIDPWSDVIPFDWSLPDG